MSKTDKELTVEIVNNFVTSWNNKGNTNALNNSDLVDLIKHVHKTIQDLPNGTKEEV